MKSLSAGSGLEFGDIVLFNVFYEAFSACTSIVAKDGNGGVIHARNMDFGLFLGFDFKNMTWSLTEALRPRYACSMQHTVCYLKIAYFTKNIQSRQY